MTLISKRMRAFILVARHNSISEAAKSLSLTVSPVSRLVTELEAYCNKVLFERKGNKIIITPEGDKLLKDIEFYYDRLAEIEANLKVSARKKINTLVYDWGKDFFIYKLSEYFIKHTELQGFDFMKIGEQMILPPDNHMLYLTSEIVPSNFHDIYHFKMHDSLLIYHHKSFEIDNPDKLLILHKEQQYHTTIKSNLENIMKKYYYSNVKTVSSEASAYEMIRQGYGSGIVTSSTLNLSQWKNENLVVNETGYNIPLYLMIPKGEQHKSSVELISKILNINTVSVNITE
ncbi:LysR family transcriptional regulator [Pantoea endophytica]|uniref:LysR family transcriptional regulator n=1 Tax=Pantoea sp. BJ2 TaxID=3141322 RepID=A0AAU7U3E2_9GAMM